MQSKQWSHWSDHMTTQNSCKRGENRSGCVPKDESDVLVSVCGADVFILVSLIKTNSSSCMEAALGWYWGHEAACFFCVICSIYAMKWKEFAKIAACSHWATTLKTGWLYKRVSPSWLMKAFLTKFCFHSSSAGPRISQCVQTAEAHGKCSETTLAFPKIPVGSLM